jgi:hypothetical protein
MNNKSKNRTQTKNKEQKTRNKKQSISIYPDKKNQTQQNQPMLFIIVFKSLVQMDYVFEMHYLESF